MCRYQTPCTRRFTSTMLRDFALVVYAGQDAIADSPRTSRNSSSLLKYSRKAAPTLSSFVALNARCLCRSVLIESVAIEERCVDYPSDVRRDQEDWYAGNEQHSEGQPERAHGSMLAQRINTSAA